MRIYANKDSVNIVSPESATTGAYNAVDCKFSLESELTECGKIMAIFSPQNGGTTVESDITSTLSCKFPPFDDSCRVAVGIYAYDVSGDTLTLRYSPSPAYVSVIKGSYVEDAEHPVAPDANTYALLLNAISLCELTSTAESRIKLLNSSSDVNVETLDSGTYRVNNANIVVWIDGTQYIKLTDGILTVSNESLNGAWNFSGWTAKKSPMGLVVNDMCYIRGAVRTENGVATRTYELPLMGVEKVSFFNESLTTNQVLDASETYYQINKVRTDIEGDLDSVAALIGGAS